MARKLARGISFVFLSEVLSMAAKGGLLLLLTRFLFKPAEYGLFSLTLSVLGVSMFFANLGTTKAGAKYINTYQEKSPELVPTVIRLTLLYKIFLVTAVGTVLILLRGRIASLVGEPSIGPLLVIGAGYVVTRSFQGNVRYFFHAFNRIRAMAVTSIISNVILFISVPLLIVYGFGLNGAIFGYALGYGIAAIVGLIFIYYRLYSHHEISTKDKKLVSKRILRYSAPLVLSRGSNTLNGHADRILLSIFRGPTAIAFYTLSKQISGFLIMPARSLGMGTSPTVGEQKAKNELVGAASIYEQSFIYTVALYAPAVAGVVLVAEPTLRLIFSDSYVQAAPALQVFSIYVLARALNAITNDALDYLGRAKARAVAKATLTLGNVVLNILLIPPYGIVGAAVATVSTYCVYVGIELIIIMDELPIDKRLLFRASLEIAAITAGMSIVVYQMTSYISNIPSLAAVVSLGGVVWLVLTMLSDIVDPRQVYTMLT